MTEQLDLDLEETLDYIHVEYFETSEETLTALGICTQKDMPNPTSTEILTPEFNALWEIIKSWDINAPEYYQGYCGGNGSHVKILLDAIKPFLKNSAPVKIPRF